MSLEPILAATLLAEFLFVVFGIVLSIPTLKLAQRQEWWTSSLAVPIALIACTRVGGLILSVPVAVILTILFYVLTALRRRSARWAKVLIRVLCVTFVAWLGVLLVTLPIRIAHEHSSRLIAYNV